jgi:hypothetical protein
MYNMYRIHVWELCLTHPEPSPLGRGHKRARLLEATEPREGAPHMLTIVKCPVFFGPGKAMLRYLTWFPPIR